MEAVDRKPEYKTLYQPKSIPAIVEVPVLRFLTVAGSGDPNGEAFAEATAALYSLSYAVRMSYKSNVVPEGYEDYKVFPLEGVWDLVDRSKSHEDKSNLAYTLMIRQPDFFSEALFERFLKETRKKKPNPFLEHVRFVQVSEGLCCQMMHLGSYDDEPASFDLMHQFCREKGYERVSLLHREIYLSDPRKTAVEKRKTVLRFQVKPV